MLRRGEWRMRERERERERGDKEPIERTVKSKSRK
jgi:hypothetical protein